MMLASVFSSVKGIVGRLRQRGSNIPIAELAIRAGFPGVSAVSFADFKWDYPQPVMAAGLGQNRRM
jgi:hypothetical protein